MITETVIECCPHCDHENTFHDIDLEKSCYCVPCQNCGASIMLCSECLGAEDNEERYCDWDRRNDKKCFRYYGYTLPQLPWK